jgi:hypothetical protein
MNKFKCKEVFVFHRLTTLAISISYHEQANVLIAPFPSIFGRILQFPFRIPSQKHERQNHSCSTASNTVGISFLAANQHKTSQTVN